MRSFALARPTIPPTVNDDLFKNTLNINDHSSSPDRSRSILIVENEPCVEQVKKKNYKKRKEEIDEKRISGSSLRSLEARPIDRSAARLSFIL